MTGAFYLRLVGKPVEVYKYLEPLYNDYRKVRLRHADGNFGLTHMDEVVDDMLNKEYLFDIAMPRIPNRCDNAFRCKSAKCSTHLRLSCAVKTVLEHL